MTDSLLKGVMPVSGTPPRSVRQLADDYLERRCRLDPVYATLAGRPGFDDRLPDYSPEGWAAQVELAETTLARLRRLHPPATAQESPAGPDATQTPEGLLAAVLGERLTAEIGYLRSGMAARFNLVSGPPSLIGECLTQADPTTPAGLAALVGRLRAVPAALQGCLRTLRWQAERGEPPARRQVEAVLAGIRSGMSTALLGGLTGPDDAADQPGAAAALRELRAAASVAEAGYREFAEALAREILPAATADDAVGGERYAAAAHHLLGVDLDLEQTYGWLTDRLADLRHETEALARRIQPDGDLRAVCDRLDAEPAWRVRSPDELRDWARQVMDDAFDLVTATLVDVPEQLREVDCLVVPAAQPGPVRYLPPAADLSRPGRVVWPVPSGQGLVPVWSQVTTVHHEGVPGHHLQLGATVLNPELSDWQRHTVIPGHAEGWAVYAEGLMAETGALDRPEIRLGYLMGLRTNVAYALAELGAHVGLPVPAGVGAEPGGPWTAERMVAFLAANSTVPEHLLHFTVVRGLGWAGQALTYPCGARFWQEARELAARRQGTAFDPRRFHADMLRLGPCGLSVLGDAAAG